MKLRKSLKAVITATMVLTIGLTGCASSSNTGGVQVESPQPGEEVGTDSGSLALAADQTLNLFFETPTTLDVNDVRNQSEFQVLSQVQEGLVRVFTDEAGNETVEPAGAESWSVSDDNLVWTFKLRDYKWSDGEPVTAQNYVDSMIRLLDPEKAFSYAFVAYDIKNGEAYYNGEVAKEEVGVKAIDDKTLEITLQKPTPEFEKKIVYVCLFPVRLDNIEAGGESWATDYTKQVYSGPFIIKEWIKENSMILTKNPNYWDAENVHLETVNMTIVEEASTKALMFESEQMDVVQGQPNYTEKWKQMAEQGQFKYIEGTLPSTTLIAFNHNTGGMSGLVGNAKIRQALSLAMDRQELLDLIYGRHFPAYGLIPYGIQTGDSNFRDDIVEPLKAIYDEYNGDSAKLQALFKEGLKELGKNEELSDVTITLITAGSTTEDKALQEYLKQSIESKLGIHFNVSVLADSKLFVAERNENRYDMLLNGWNGDYNDPMTFMDMWITDSGFSKFFGFYSSENYDKIFATLDGEMDKTKREQIYAELEKEIIADNAGIIPLYYRDSKVFVQNYVQDLSTPMFGPSLEFSRAYISEK